MVPLYIFEDRYKQMVQDLLGSDREEFGVVLAGPGQGFRSVGGLVELVAVSENPDGSYNILTRGTGRFRVAEVNRTDRPYLLAHCPDFPLERGQATQEHLASWDALEAYRSYMAGKADPQALEEAIASLPDDPLYQASFLCVNLGAPAAERQGFLEAASLLERFDRLQQFMQNPRESGGVTA